MPFFGKIPAVTLFIKGAEAVTCNYLNTSWWQLQDISLHIKLLF